MSKSDTGNAGPAQRFVFSTDQFPAGLDDQARFQLWRDLQEEYVGSLDVARGEDRPFWARMEFVQFGACGIGQYSGTFTRVGRTASDVARDGRDSLSVALSRGRSPVSVSLRGREAVLRPGSATLVSYADPGHFQFAPGFGLVEVLLPRSRLPHLVTDTGSLIARPFDPNQPALRLLQRYVEILLVPDGIDDDPLLAAHIETTLVDLIALALGASRDAADVASMRGLRAARLLAVLTEIKAGFADPAFSAHDIARRLGLSPRYIQDLLQESGASFSERVLELRLQQARAMLASPEYGHAQVSQIAYACGFNQVPYFNRRFRRRFGAAPTEYRGGVWV